MTQDFTSHSRVRALLLDVDGTLLDSNDAHARAWVHALERHGHSTSFDLVRPYIGKGGDKLLDDLFGIDDESEEGRAIDEARRTWFAHQALASLRPTRGARELLERCVAAGLRLIVATSASGEELGGLLRQAGIDDLIQATASSSDAQSSKPEPDIVRAALDKAGVRADEAVMLGDTPYDIQAATGAGVATIALRCGGWWDDAALRGAAAIHDDPAALLAGWAGSPLSVGIGKD